jgi:autotransporter-associated beta strand protein
MRKLYFVVIVAVALIASGALNAQNLNDFRSKSDGNWNVVNVWEHFNGSEWENATYYPGNGATGDVLISHAITSNVLVNLPSDLVVDGNLTVTSFDFSVAGNTLISGVFSDNNNTGVTTFSGSVTLIGSATFNSTSLSTAGRMIFGSDLIHNSTETVSVRPAIINGNLVINNGGTFHRTNTGELLVGGSTSVSGASSVIIAGNSLATFSGLVTLDGNSTWTSTGVTTSGFMLFENGISHTSTGAMLLGGASFNVNNQTIAGIGAGLLNFASVVTIGDDVSLTNERNVIISGTLNGTNENSTFINHENSMLEYHAAAVPMTTGILNASADNNVVWYNGNLDQTLKVIDYNQLSLGTNGFTTNRNKTFENAIGDLTINGDWFIGDRSIANLGLGNKNIKVNGNVILETSNTWLRTQNVNDAIHTLTINGYLETNGGEVRLRYDNNSRYCDLIMTGAGELIRGTGAVFNLRNLTFTNEEAKTVTYNGNIDFFGGLDANHFTNNGGAFTATAGAFRFYDLSEYSINGTGLISFNDFRVGTTSATNPIVLTLNRDVTVNGLFHIRHTATTGYLDLNGHALNVNGGFYRQDAGQFRGSATSVLNFGNGSELTGTTPNIAFQTDYQILAELNHNVSNNALFYNLVTPLSVANLNISSGEFRSGANVTITNSYLNNGIYNQTANSTFFDKPTGTIAISGSGQHSFWSMVVQNGTVTLAGDITIKQNFISNSNEDVAFNATSGNVFFNREGDAFIQGAGAGEVNFYNLIFSETTGTRNRFIDRDFKVANLMRVNNRVVVYFSNTASRTLDVHNLIVGGGISGQLLVSATGANNHLLTVNGAMTVNNGAVFNMRNATTRYADVVLTGSGTVLQGGGSFTFRSLLLNNESAKSFNTSSNINFYSGEDGNNYFTNNGGSFSTSNANLIFRDHDVNWNFGGTGEVTLANLQIGANTRTNLTMGRDIAITNGLVFYMSAATNYLDVNNNTLTLSGNHTRLSNGRIRGSATSSLIINGTGGFTSTFAFDQETPGATNFFNTIDINRSAAGQMVLANLLETNALSINQGILNGGAGSIMVNVETNIVNGSFIDNNNGGTNSFNGLFTVSENGSFNPVSTSVNNFSGSVVNNGIFVKEGTGILYFTGNSTLSGTKPFYFNAGSVVLNSGVEVVNTVLVDEEGVFMAGRLNGTDAASTWINQGIFEYHDGNAPMLTGVLDASETGNIVIYAREQNTQNVKEGVYYHLVNTGGGTRTLVGDITVNGDFRIGEDNLFYTERYQVSASATGKLIMEELSELRIGRNADPSPVFPTGFIRENIELDPISLISYNGVTQQLSHVPVYTNLSIIQGGNKTMTGDVTVNGFFNITAGTLVFGDAVAQTFTLYGDLFGTGGRINMSGGGHNHVLDLYGVVNQVNRFTAAPNSLVRYASGIDQQIFSPTGGDYYGNVEIAGGSKKWLELMTEIRGELKLTSGKLSLGDQNLVIYNPGTITGSFSDDNMIVTDGTGTLVRRSASMSAPYTYLTGIYPVGSDGKYSPVQIVSLAGSGTGTRELSVKALEGRHPSVPFTYDALLRYWKINSTVVNPTANMLFAINPLEVIGDPEKFNAYFWNGNDFVNPIGAVVGATIMEFPAGTSMIDNDFTAYDPETIRRTLYSYKDGDWNDPDTWTTDPSGQNLEGADVPKSSDNIVVLPTKTVVLNNNIDTRGLIITINESGVLDMGVNAFEEPVSIIQGEGRLKLASNQMPLTALNSLVKPNGGTIEYNVADAIFELNGQQE